MAIYLVVTAHQSEYPDPISFSKGALLEIGDKYQGPEDWQNWYFCSTETHPGGWVPIQVFETIQDGKGIALEDYCARELDVIPGDTLYGTRMLNGWLWSQRQDENDSGWVPLANLQPV